MPRPGSAVPLSVPAARRIALAAQGLDRARPAGSVNRGQVRRLLHRLGLLQIDSVNVLTRAHYLPVFSRLGPYPRAALDRLVWADHEFVEYWAHEASVIPAASWPLFRWRMARLRGGGGWGRAQELHRQRPGYVRDVLAEVSRRGPLAARDLDDLDQPAGRARAGGAWWDWRDAKIALEELFAEGELAVAGRVNFERRYDLPSRVLGPELAALVPDEHEALRELLRISAAALGVATAADLLDYFRLRGRLGAGVDPLARLAELVEAGELLPADVRGWDKPAYLWPAAKAPRTVEAKALLAPFDPLVFERSRTERLFGFRYRIEIYVPAARRVHGYYVLPFLLGDTLVARVDLKADRAAGELLVRSAFAEPDAPAHTAGALADELAQMARWLELDRVRVGGPGELTERLSAAVRASQRGVATGRAAVSAARSASG